MYDYPQSIQQLINSIESSTDISPQILGRFVEQSNIQPEELEPWVDLAHPITDSYGRKLVYEGKNFEIMVMAWQPGDFSAIHDHGGTQWGTVQYYGPAEHVCFRVKNDVLSMVFEETTNYRQINLVNNALIHQMGNPSDKPFLSLHTYGTTTNKRPITCDSRIFEVYRHEIQYTNGGVFYHLPENEINFRKEGIKADQITREKHYFQMLMRTHFMLNSGNMNSEEKADLENTAQALQAHIYSPKNIDLFHNQLQKLDFSDGPQLAEFWKSMSKEVSWQSAQ